MLSSIDAPASRSPSPAPQPPSVTLPGPRSTALRAIFTAALTATLKTNNYANFSTCFPTPAAHCPQALEGVWKQLNAKLEEGCMREFEGILNERTVVAGLNEWDAVLEAARRRKNKAAEGTDGGDEQVHVMDDQQSKALHTLSAEELYTAHLTPYLQRAEAALEARLAASQVENQRLMERVRGQREEIERLVGGLEDVVRDLEGCVQALHGESGGEAKVPGVKGLREEVWEMNDMLQTAG